MPAALRSSFAPDGATKVDIPTPFPATWKASFWPVAASPVPRLMTSEPLVRVTSTFSAPHVVIASESFQV